MSDLDGDEPQLIPTPLRVSPGGKFTFPLCQRRDFRTLDVRIMSNSVKSAAKAKSTRSAVSTRAFSSIVVDGIERAPSRGMLYATGFKKEDFKKPQVGVASTWSMVTPCNMHIDQLAVSVAQGINGAGGKAVVFNTITISDGISMGTEGMKYSLVSREVIADSIETVVGCQGFDGFVAVGGCDKNMPGCLMACLLYTSPSPRD